MIKAITIDFGGTLASGDLDKDYFLNELLKYIRSLGFKGTVAQLKRARNKMFAKLMKVRRLNRELRLEDLYQGMLFQIGLHPNYEVIENIHQLYMQSFNTDLLPHTDTVLQKLYKNYRLAVISNAMSNIPRHAIDKFGLGRYFQAIVISRDLGVRKPDLEIFKFTLNKLGVENYEAMHVGDSLEEDVQGAKNAGMKTIWIRNANQEVTVPPDYAIRSLRELTFLLKK
jgi:putative hydrolase of the HAD superfamily